MESGMRYIGVLAASLAWLWSSVSQVSRRNDGTTSFITIDPTVDGFTFVVGEREGKRALVIRDNQHEYPLIESASRR